MSVLSKSQVDKLGERLRSASEPSAEDRELLQALLAAHSHSFEEARRVIVANIADSHSVSARLKSTPSIVEKLKRTPAMQLSRMQDLAGVRIVVQGGRAAQDRIVQALVQLFDRTRVVDRRLRPQHGYRAVHVIAQVEQRNVEIQVRTMLQHEWAELFEKVADQWGRQIRYGLVANEPDRKIGSLSRQQMVDYLMTLAGTIARQEESADLAGSEVRLAELRKYLDTLRTMLRVIQ